MIKSEKIKQIKQEQVTSGSVCCQGCGAAIAMRLVLKVLGPDTMIVIPACCWTILSGINPFTVFKVPMLHCAFETAAITASGISRGLKMQGKSNINVLAWAGDGGTFDIGIQALSGAAERGENIIYSCYDNEGLHEYRNSKEFGDSGGRVDNHHPGEFSRGPAEKRHACHHDRS